MKRSVALTAIALVMALFALPLLAGVARAGSAGPVAGASTPQAGTAIAPGLTVVGTGRVPIQPDRAHLTVGVQSMESTAQAAQSATSKTMAAVINALKALPMVKNAHTVNVSLYPHMPPPDQGSAPRQPTAFQSEQTLGLTVTDVHAVGRVLDAAVKAGANTQIGVSFSISDASKARAQALAEAVADGRKQARQAAQAAGLTLKGMTAMTVLSSSSGAQGVGAGGGNAGPTILPGAVQVDVSVQMTFAY